MSMSSRILIMFSNLVGLLGNVYNLEIIKLYRYIFLERYWRFDVHQEEQWEKNSQKGN